MPALLPAAWIAVCAACGAVQPDTRTELSGNIELARLVDLAAQRLRLNIEYDSGALSGTVTLRLAGALSDEELWALVNRVLAARGLTTVRSPGGESLSVVKIGDAAGVARIEEPGGPAAPGPAPGFTTTVVRTRHRPPAEVAEVVGRILGRPNAALPATTAGAAPRSGGGLIVLSDLTSRVEQALRLVELLDTPSVPTRIEEVPARNLAPTALATAVAQLVAKRELVSGEKVPGEVVASPTGRSVLLVAPEDRLEFWRGLIAAADQRERVETQTYSPRAFSAREVAGLVEQTVRDLAPGDDRWRLVVDDLTGTLIATATPVQHQAIQDLMERLEATPVAARRPVRAFVVRNRSVRDLVPILQELLAAGVLEGGEIESATAGGPASQTTRREVLPPATPTPAPAQPTPPDDVQAAPPAAGVGEARLTLTADEATNTIIAMGEPRLLEQVETIIARLDVRQPQVMLEVLLVSLTESQTLNLGVELEKLELSGDTLWRLSSLFGLSTRAGSGDSRNVGDRVGFTGVVLNPGDFSIVIRALQTLSNGRSLSMPRVLVGNNQQAVLDSVLQQPFASTNASDTVATTSFGGTQDAGTTVSIRPQIAEGGHLLLEYQVALSAFVGQASDPTLPPPRQQNRVQSVADIPDGHTVVVGGIDLETTGKSESRVPLLGAIPILGEAFKNRSNTDSRSRFFVFIKATVLRARGFEDLKYLSEGATAEAGIDDGWPELEPRIMR